MIKKIISCLALLILISLFFKTSAYAQATTFTGLRDGEVWIRVEAGSPSVNLAWVGVYETDMHEDFYALYGPDGRQLYLGSVAKGIAEGAIDLPLNAGPGDYRVEFMAQVYRAYTVTVPDGLKAVYSPNPFHVDLHRLQSHDRWYFNVPPDTDSFSLSGRSYSSSGSAQAEIYSPSGSLASSFQLPPDTASDAYAPYNSQVINSPVPGVWRVVFNEINDGRVSFWLAGIPNYFALEPASLFVPNYQSGTAHVDGSGLIKGPVGLIGATSYQGEPYPEAVHQAIDFMGLESANYYVDMEWREPVNDNNDPQVINWPAFNWGDEARMSNYIDQVGLTLSSLFDLKTDWNQHPPETELARNEAAEFILSYLIHHNIDHDRYPQNLYFSLEDEPNEPHDDPKFTESQYWQLYQTVVPRIRAYPDPRVNQVKFLYPSSSQFFDGLPGETTGSEWAENAYQAGDALIDGIAWDQWMILHLMGTWRYYDAVNQAAAIIAEHNTDGQAEEAIVINQTNLSWGETASPLDVNTFKAALWWASVAIETQRTGKITMLNWFTLVDDNHHKKGLLYNDFQLKPAAFATRMITAGLLDQVIETNSDHPEVDAILTANQANDKLSLLVVNKLKRQNNLDLTLNLPPELRSRAFTVSAYRLQAGDIINSQLNDKQVVLETFSGTTGESLALDYVLEPETIYRFEFDLDTIDISIRQLLSQWGEILTAYIGPPDFNTDGYTNGLDFAYLIAN